jgi:hypothetical protein
VSGLTDDVATALEPVRRMSERLSAVERDVVEQALDAVRGICEDEERESQVLVDEFNKLQDEMEDR